jgi:hypothetical protein
VTLRGAGRAAGRQVGEKRERDRAWGEEGARPAKRSKDVGLVVEHCTSVSLVFVVRASRSRPFLLFADGHTRVYARASREPPCLPRSLSSVLIASTLWESRAACSPSHVQITLARMSAPMRVGSRPSSASSRSTTGSRACSSSALRIPRLSAARTRANEAVVSGPFLLLSPRSLLLLDSLSTIFSF